jgi:hypothetical protein
VTLTERWLARLRQHDANNRCFFRGWELTVMHKRVRRLEAYLVRRMCR